MITSTVAILFAVGYLLATVWLCRGIRLTARDLCLGGIVCAMTLVLATIRIPLPTGSNITCGSWIPLMLLALLYDYRLSMLSGWVCGILAMILIPGWQAVHWAQIFVQQLVCFSCLGYAGVFGSDKRWKAICGMALAVAMPLSWLPLISDYTREAEKPVQATWVSVVVYGLVSCWMYVIGMGAAIFTGEYDIAVIMVKAGLGIAALVILVFSTVTTTFLDAWSAGISAESLSKKLNGKKTAIAVTVIGAAGAILFPMDDITGFLYLIGSVFAPMIAVQIADHFLLKRDRFAVAADGRNLVIWLVGFIAYRWLMGVDTPVGYTLPDMVLTVLLCVLAEKLCAGKKNG